MCTQNGVETNLTVVMADEILNKEQALNALTEGKTISHASFTDEETLKMENGKYVFEDGVKCYPDEFWKYRQLPSWNYYWRIVNI